MDVLIFTKITNLFVEVVLKAVIMELCSLEEEDYGDMFITQESPNIVPLVPNFNGDCEMDSNSDVLEIGKTGQTKYSNISDVEDFELPLSQARLAPM